MFVMQRHQDILLCRVLHLLGNLLVESAHRHVVSDLAKVLRAAGRVRQAGVHAVVVDARLLQVAVLVRLALALQIDTQIRLVS